ncbi:hypothetical protein D915_001802 [Fasciola hepatica]|uniref:Uncharacterized protein n=1 Tax=Fasciola hepatica TaxID=6192 RepID=A0A4E0RYC7_FASHE|nr:hypothetical protein D915_001802 [Fasciola hepatica]
MSSEITTNSYGGLFLQASKCMTDCSRILKRGYLHRLQCKVAFATSKPKLVQVASAHRLSRLTDALLKMGHTCERLSKWTYGDDALTIFVGLNPDESACLQQISTSVRRIADEMYQTARNTHPSDEIPPRDVEESEVENVIKNLQEKTEKILEQLASFIHVVDQIQFVGRKPITLDELFSIGVELPIKCRDNNISKNSIVSS